MVKISCSGLVDSRFQRRDPSAGSSNLSSRSFLQSHCLKMDSVVFKERKFPETSEEKNTGRR